MERDGGLRFSPNDPKLNPTNSVEVPLVKALAYEIDELLPEDFGVKELLKALESALHNLGFKIVKQVE